MLVFNLVHGEVSADLRNALGAPRYALRQVTRVYRLSSVQNDRTLDDVPELWDVAGPLVHHERLLDGVRKRQGATSQTTRNALEEHTRQRDDIGPPVA